jgi:hypothetical protein
MSLDWNAQGVRDLHLLHGYDYEAKQEMYEEGTPEYDEARWQRSVTQAVVYRMMATDIGWQITEKNVEKLAFRSAILDQLFGKSLQRWDGDNIKHIALTYDDYVRRVGLKTNVSSVTDAKFKANVWATMEREANAFVRPKVRMHEARELIRSLKAGDDWTEEHDRAGKVIGWRFDPDNYRLIDTGKVTFDTGQSILDHYDNYIRSLDEQKEKAS